VIRIWLMAVLVVACSAEEDGRRTGSGDIT